MEVNGMKSVNFGSGSQMVRIFCKDSSGEVFKGALITTEAAKTFSDKIHADRVAKATGNNIPKNSVFRDKQIFLGPDATIEEAKKLFDKIA